MNQNRNTSSGPLPTYLKNVTSKIRDQVQQDKIYSANTHTQNAPVEIYVGPPPNAGINSGDDKADQRYSNRHH